jgi:hypothetical protein
MFKPPKITSMKRIEEQSSDCYVDAFNIQYAGKEFKVFQEIWFNEDENNIFGDFDLYLMEPKKKGRGTHGQMRHPGQTLVYGNNGSNKHFTYNNYEKKFKPIVDYIFSIKPKDRNLLMKLDDETKEAWGDVITGL